jgi:hypothetical protein
MTVTPVDLGVKDRCKFEMFISVNDFNGTRQRLFAAWEWVRKIQFKHRNVENSDRPGTGAPKHLFKIAQVATYYNVL